MTSLNKNVVDQQKQSGHSSQHPTAPGFGSPDGGMQWIKASTSISPTPPKAGVTPLYIHKFPVSEDNVMSRSHGLKPEPQRRAHHVESVDDVLRSVSKTAPSPVSNTLIFDNQNHNHHYYKSQLSRRKPGSHHRSQVPKASIVINSSSSCIDRYGLKQDPLKKTPWIPLCASSAGNSSNGFVDYLLLECLPPGKFLSSSSLTRNTHHLL